ncbi:MAG TPA: glycosyltransferase [Alphaproteobacteria bacterium]|jgi:glycosyltransferase involved in cell wall biosynthesis|nr:glycosyltransferase [Alphaproteobacteria bacterium]
MISIVIPIYNEEANIAKLAESILKALSGIEYEVLFINDGSTDNSEKEIQAISKSNAHIKLINLRRNYGQTAAMQAGFDHSKGNIVIPMDGDLQNDPKDIPMLIEKINEGYDVVSGWRKIRSDKKFTRIIPSKIANMLISKISGIHLHDYGCTLKAYRKDILNDIKLYGEMHRFIPIYASWEGAKVTEVAVHHHPRTAGKTKYGLSRIPRVILDLLVIRFFDKSLDRPIHLFGQFGLLMFLIAFLLFLLAIFLKIFMNISFILTPLPLLVVFFSMSGLLCIFIGLVAEIQSRIYFEARDRPLYLVRKNLTKINTDKDK